MAATYLTRKINLLALSLCLFLPKKVCEATNWNWAWTWEAKFCEISQGMSLLLRFEIFSSDLLQLNAIILEEIFLLRLGLFLPLSQKLMVSIARAHSQYMHFLLRTAVDSCVSAEIENFISLCWRRSTSKFAARCGKCEWTLSTEFFHKNFIPGIAFYTHFRWSFILELTIVCSPRVVTKNLCLILCSLLTKAGIRYCLQNRT